MRFAKLPPYASVRAFITDRNDAIVYAWAKCSSTPSNPLARARRAAAANHPGMRRISSRSRSSMVCR